MHPLPQACAAAELQNAALPKEIPLGRMGEVLQQNLMWGLFSEVDFGSSFPIFQKRDCLLGGSRRVVSGVIGSLTVAIETMIAIHD